MAGWERERERERERESDSEALHQVEKYIQRLLLLRASSTGGWYSARSQPEGQLAPLWTNAQTAWLVYSADCSLWLITGVENFHYILYIFLTANTFLPTQFTWYFHCPFLALRHSNTSCFWNPYNPPCERGICNIRINDVMWSAKEQRFYPRLSANILSSHSSKSYVQMNKMDKAHFS